jgi:hypothetical protein
MFPKDKGTWGLLLAAIAIVLAIPLSMVGNILTPKFLNWWAERSVASTRKRIDGLEKRLAELEKDHPVMNEVEEYLMKGIEAGGFLVVLCLELIAAILLVVTGLALSLTPPKINDHVAVLSMTASMLAAGAGYVVAYFVFKKIADFRKERSPSRRTALKTAVKELRTRLVERTMK